MNRKQFQLGQWLALGAVLVAGCASPTSTRKTEEAKMTSLDKVLTGVPDPKMQELWRKADAAGKLPPTSAIPEPVRPVSYRRPVRLKEPATAPRRPVIPPQTVADVQPFSSTPLTEYEGAVTIVKQTPGLLICKLANERADSLELHYKLPGPARAVALADGAAAQLIFRDEVVDSALQRRIILYTSDGSIPLAYIAEGSMQPYKQSIEAVRLTIEQEPMKTEGNPPLKITYRDRSLTVKPGERQRLGTAQALDIRLLDSIAMPPAKALLQEGQPYYVRLILYRAR